MYHAECLKRHAQKRARQRLGIELTDRIHKGIVKRIKNGKLKLHTRDGRIIICYTKIKGVKCRIVYDNKYEVVKTLIPIHEVNELSGFTRELKQDDERADSISDNRTQAVGTAAN